MGFGPQRFDWCMDYQYKQHCVSGTNNKGDFCSEELVIQIRSILCCTMVYRVVSEVRVYLHEEY